MFKRMSPKVKKTVKSLNYTNPEIKRMIDKL